MNDWFYIGSTKVFQLGSDIPALLRYTEIEVGFKIMVGISGFEASAHTAAGGDFDCFSFASRMLGIAVVSEYAIVLVAA